MTNLPDLPAELIRVIYQYRWTIETVFSAIKRRQGSAVRSRSDWSWCRDL